MRDTPLHYLDVSEVAEALANGGCSAVELTEYMLARIAALEPNLGAYTTLTAERALDEARSADRARAQGKRLGALHGVPIAVKDIFDVSGTPTTAGMAIHREQLATRDATVIERLRAAGAVLLGKLTLTEGVYAEHRPPFPAPRNPWHAAYWSGASSSGNGVAVAAGLCFAALGSETGGSIRLPSAANGVTGLKPTWGRVSRHATFELAATLDHVGPMARTARDAGAMLGVIAGADPRDPSAALAPVPDYLAGGVEIGELRVGIDAQWLARGTDTETLTAFERATAVLAELGARLVPIQVPDVQDMIWDWFPICAVQTARAHAATFPARREQYGPALTSLLEQGLRITDAQYQALVVKRREFSARVQALFAQIDLLALPVLGFPAPTVERMRNIDDDIIAGLHRFTCPFNLSGNPAIVLPNGCTADGMPIVFQLIGRHFDEAMLVRAGRAYQAHTEWHERYPDLG